MLEAQNEGLEELSTSQTIGERISSIKNELDEDTTALDVDFEAKPASLIPKKSKKRMVEFETDNGIANNKVKMEFDGVLLPLPYRKRIKLESESALCVHRVNVPCIKEVLTAYSLHASNAPKTHARVLQSNSSDPGDTESESEESKETVEIKAEQNDDDVTFVGKSIDLEYLDIKPKIKVELELSRTLVQIRLDQFSCAPYPINLDRRISERRFSREFIHSVFGGSPYAANPPIGKEFLARHGRAHLMFWNNCKYQPNAKVGESGLFYESRPFSPKDDNEFIHHGFSCFAPNEWWEPTDDEIEEAQGLSDEYKHISAEEIKNAFDQGEQCLGILVLKCVGYDEDLQRELVQKFPSWVPKIKSGGKKAKKSAKRKKKNMKTRKVKAVREHDAIEEAGHVAGSDEAFNGTKAQQYKHWDQKSTRPYRIDQKTVAMALILS
ncbi:hypothetical protein C8R41DRAFT_984913 [Lentinula lateritia]|uniref:DUF6697 domain-containing protein n=1 Tax=Lentinula lateritia TaxID=40482 RepID=A0ABQ8UZK2_9AGAR|nr:hypothetical protein C8R41DRAFT_984913 [Lentinula lateritia]